MPMYKPYGLLMGMIVSVNLVVYYFLGLMPFCLIHILLLYQKNISGSRLAENAAVNLAAASAYTGRYMAREP